MEHNPTPLSCYICDAEVETIYHALFECKAAKEIWAQSELTSQFENNPHSTFSERWNWLTSLMNASSVRKVASLLWAAWFCRNKMFFEQYTPNVVVVAAGFVRLVEDYNRYVNQVSFNTTLPMMLDRMCHLGNALQGLCED